MSFSTTYWQIIWNKYSFRPGDVYMRMWTGWIIVSGTLLPKPLIVYHQLGHRTNSSVIFHYYTLVFMQETYFKIVSTKCRLICLTPMCWKPIMFTVIHRLWTNVGTQPTRYTSCNIPRHLPGITLPSGALFLRLCNCTTLLHKYFRLAWFVTI